MTNAEAIEHLKNIKIFSYQDEYTAEEREAIKMAFKALKAQELSNNSPKHDSGNGKLATDTISRQGALDALDINRNPVFHDSVDYEGVMYDICKLSSTQPEQTRIFVELVVEYPDPELCTYKEYKGKPYYSIKYIENGETYVGYGTYKPEVLSQFLREYFIPSAQPEDDENDLNFVQPHKRIPVQLVVSGDCISRQAAINAIRASAKKYTGFMEMEMYTDDDAVEAIEGLPSVQPEHKYHDPFGNPIYVYVRVGDKTVSIKADDLQKALDYVTEHGEEVTIEERRTDE